MQIPGGIRPLVVLDGLQDVQEPVVVVLAFARTGVAAEFADNHRQFGGRHLHFCNPNINTVALVVITVVGINHTVALGIGQLPAIQDAGKIVSPVESATDDDILRARDANGVQHRLHAHALVVFRHRISPIGFVLDVAAVEPDIPGDIVRFIIQIKDDGWIVGVNRRATFPERNAVQVGHGMLADVRAPFVAIRPMQIKNDVTMLGGTLLHDLFDQSAIGLAAVVLFARLCQTSDPAKAGGG